MTRPLCGSCHECHRGTRALLRPAIRATAPGPRPTRDGLERHARKYGPELVPETAAEYGITVAVELPKTKRRRGSTLKERVRGYLDDGYSAEVIAEIEDLTPGRARRLVAELS